MSTYGDDTGAEFAERVRRNQAKLISDLKPQYDFIVRQEILKIQDSRQLELFDFRAISNGPNVALTPALMTLKIERFAGQRGVEFRRQRRKEQAMNNRILYLLVIIILLASPVCVLAQQEGEKASGEVLALDEAISLALRNNHLVKVAQLTVARADEDILAAKTSRLPSLHTHALVSGNLARNSLKVPNPAANLFPGLGDFFILNVDRKPTAVFAVSAIEPLTQQYRIGLQIKQEKLSREAAQAKLRQQENETVDQVKKVYYSIMQTQSALRSVQ